MPENPWEVPVEIKDLFEDSPEHYRGVPSLGVPVTEERMRQIIREELEHLVRGERVFLEAFERAKCTLGKAHLLEEHPMEDPPGAD
jgi:hypothetical protein